MTVAELPVSEPEVSSGTERQPWVRALAALVCVAIPVAFWLAPLGIAENTKIALAITLFMILAWMTRLMEYAAVGLIGCLLYWMTGVAEPRAAFDGFANPNTWFVLAAILIGLIASRSGLPQRISSFIITRIGLSYSRILLGLIITDFVLTLIVPTALGRVVIMATIALSLIRLFDVKGMSNVGRGMFLILTYTATIFDKMILSGVSSVIARANIIEHGGVQITWGYWFISFLPCDLLTILAAWRLTIWFYPPEVASLAGREQQLREQLRVDTRWTPQAKKAAALVLGTVAVWVTDFLHGIDPALVALACALIALLPYVGVISTEDVRRTNLLPFFFVGAALSMSTVLRDTGGLRLLTDTVFAGFEPLLANEVVAVPVLYWGAFIYHLFLASELSMLATSLPILMDVATTHGFNPLWIGLVWTFAAGGKLFVYQSAVLVVGYSYGYFKHTDLIKMGMALTIAEFLGVLLTTALWWPVIGITPLP